MRVCVVKVAGGTETTTFVRWSATLVQLHIAASLAYE
jgi:hypothetical protein